MTSSFSWSDHLHIALNTCLPCLRRSSSIDSLSAQNAGSATAAAASADLQRLLVDPETLSLHSTTHVRNSGRKSVKKKNSTTRGITLFGYHLFGRPPPPPIQLPTDSGDAIYNNNIPITPTLTEHSTTTFDSDAALLDTESLPVLVAPVEEAEERRARRRERKERKRLARALAVDGTVAEDFEGFQGSGNSHLPPQSSLQVQQVAYDVNGNYNHEDEDEDGGADLDGVVYTRRRQGSSSGGRGSSNSRSSSDKYRSRKKKSKYTHSSSRTADSTSLASPTISTFADITVPTVISPTTIEQGQGFFDHEDQRFVPSVPKDNFPSTGFGLRATKGGARGAFLANTGEPFDGTF